MKPSAGADRFVVLASAAADAMAPDVADPETAEIDSAGDVGAKKNPTAAPATMPSVQRI